MLMQRSTQRPLLTANRSPACSQFSVIRHATNPSCPRAKALGAEQGTGQTDATQAFTTHNGSHVTLGGSSPSSASPDGAKSAWGALAARLVGDRLSILQLAAVALPLASVTVCNPFVYLWDAYCTSLIVNPLTTKIATGAAGTFLGDLLAQVTQYREGPKEAGFSYEPIRCLRLCFFSVCIGTPWTMFWYSFLDKIVLPGQSGPHVMLAKMGVDQFLATPFFLTFFLVASKVLEGKAGTAVAFVKASLLPTLIANWKLWPMAMLFNFSIVPPDFRILFVNAVAIAWTAYLSSTVNTPKAEAAKA